jgi:hypothetical protein
MKITNISIAKEVHESKTFLVCRVATDHGDFSASTLWRGVNGIWASTAEEREPAEIAAMLRLFAKAIEREAREEGAPSLVVEG